MRYEDIRLIARTKHQGHSIAHPPVGKVVPVFVAIDCDKCEFGGMLWSTQPFIQREDVYALNSAGQYVQALTLNNAEHGAGGAAILAPLLTKLTEDQAVESYQTYSRETCVQAASLLGFLCEFAGKDRPVESQRLWATALQESAPVSGPGYRQLNYNNGWVFFPMGSYTGIKLDVCQCTSSPFSLPPPEVTCEPYKLPWVEQQGIPEGNYPSLRGASW